MNEHARRIWKTPEGVSLLHKMLEGGPLDGQHRQTLADLKRVDPPKAHPQPQPPSKEAKP